MRILEKFKFVIQNTKKHKIPLFMSTVKAGFSSPAENYIEKELDLNEFLIQNTSATFILKASGDSMINAGIKDGDLLIVDKSKTYSNNSIVIASVNGEFTVKRLKIKNNIYYLVPENSKYPTLKIEQFDDAQIWGVVIHVIHSFI